MADACAMTGPDKSSPPTRNAVSRRGFLGAGAAAAAAAAVAGCGSQGGSDKGRTTARAVGSNPADVVAFHGVRQAGIVTSQQRHLRFAAFDLKTENRDELAELLRVWSARAAELMAGTARDATGEARELAPARLTLTFGFGPSLFGGEDRFGLADRRPAALASIPSFGADAFDPRRCDGDVGVQICSDDPQVAFHAFHALSNAAKGVAEPRWLQTGFIGARPGGATNRNLLGFKDGTRNLDVRNNRTTGAQLWVAADDRTAWMTGGTYLVARRIRTVLDVWDATSVAGQEQAIGRSKETGAPLGGHAEHDTPNFAASGQSGLTIPGDAHVRLAAPEHNAGAQLLRRGYNYDDGIDADTAQVDAGLFFISFQRDPRKQFVPIQRRLAADDALAQHLIHTASAVFACPPGAASGGFVGQGLLV
jgi:deferrochelatase/peroxidase EfeB